MLLQLLDLIRHEGVVSSDQLSRALHVSSSALEPMLAVWIKKGVIQKHANKAPCNSPCFKCSTKETAYYEFLPS